ncbi:uncharacterized protein MONBRDRAFT_11009 [Monosiga brevicollis MX1]|uniref:Uncharacterized protein n=1 Tax=Monosiga brevicollis TaxID=81824 RepID=A9V7X9_MONBE|nr:uncharacterized protein MONBRDRAFT_11009 [Monosiga brevicollis MX1]EDQ86455.1 predicted protein [Monosiga brevicollis MX1]|eukprot:XP_001748845.1 hypothetical protein [Monosiga brevicollis MX1]
MFRVPAHQHQWVLGVGGVQPVPPPQTATAALIASHVEHALRFDLLVAAVRSLLVQQGAAFDHIVISLSTALDTFQVHRLLTQATTATAVGTATIPLAVAPPSSVGPAHLLLQALLQAVQSDLPPGLVLCGLPQPQPRRQFQHVCLALEGFLKLRQESLGHMPTHDAVILFDDDDLAHPQLLQVYQDFYIRQGTGCIFATTALTRSDLDARISATQPSSPLKQTRQPCPSTSPLVALLPSEAIDLVICQRLTSNAMEDREVQRNTRLDFLALAAACSAAEEPELQDYSGSLLAAATLNQFLEGHSHVGAIDLDGRFVDGFFRIAMQRVVTCDIQLVWQRRWRLPSELAAWQQGVTKGPQTFASVLDHYAQLAALSYDSEDEDEPDLNFSFASNSLTAADSLPLSDIALATSHLSGLAINQPFQ